MVTSISGHTPPLSSKMEPLQPAKKISEPAPLTPAKEKPPRGNIA